MREKGSWSETTYRSRARVVETKKTATFEGEERAKQGKGLDPLVDPAAYGVIRRSGNLLVPDGSRFVLKFGAAMPVGTDVDTTGSMGDNVNIAFKVQPKVQNLLVQGDGAVLRRYHTQMATGVIQDVCDKFPYQRSQYEPDNEVEKQMGLLVPEKGGGDSTEDYQISIFAATFLTYADIVKYGLRGYYFFVGDQIGRDGLDPKALERVFGEEVFKKAFSGGQPKLLPSTREMGPELLKKWHAFFLQVGNSSYVAEWWGEILGMERVVRLPRTEDLAEVQACIIGLTEGVLDLQSALDFLKGAKVSAAQAGLIVDACSGIPLGLQRTFPNFDRIPKAGSLFAKREDIWPIGMKAETDKKKKPGKKPAGDGDGKPGGDWKL